MATRNCRVHRKCYSAGPGCCAPVPIRTSDSTPLSETVQSLPIQEVESVLREPHAAALPGLVKRLNSEIENGLDEQSRNEMTVRSVIARG